MRFAIQHFNKELEVEIQYVNTAMEVIIWLDRYFGWGMLAGIHKPFMEALIDKTEKAFNDLQYLQYIPIGQTGVEIYKVNYGAKEEKLYPRDIRRELAIVR